MAKETILKKLEQLTKLLDELKAWLVKNLDFGRDLPLLRASERNFELIVENATDINALILGELKKPIPDTYQGSFVDLEKAGLIKKELADGLIETAKLRNQMVHEYDFIEDFEIFYAKLAKQISVLEEYQKAIAVYSKTLSDGDGI
jgi:uncharacterized protein YutE (UPF0331/DUF86 family)